jgi:hypothetical protein
MSREFDGTHFPAGWDFVSLRRVVSGLINKPASSKWSRTNRVKITMEDGETRSGYLSTSTGEVRTLILVPNRLSSGGYPPYGTPVRIESANKKGGIIYWDFARDEPVAYVMKN